MKKFNYKKSVIEKGGLMIEALAMLGLIAVVTPTMYKKSAERAMEVEDINTASSIRSYMNSWNDLVAAHYIDIMEVMEDSEDGNIMTLDELNTKVSELDGSLNLKDEFEKYLPYGYKADKDLYNYGEPKFAVARSGNNLTAFMVFPSKATGDDSIGQERTVRIASLIGSNGGYVRGDKARGVGGTWSLDANQLGKISDEKQEYSIVTSSVDAINSSTGGMGQDNEKYLQRTAENGELWRNMMHTDIYMGNLEQTAGDPYGMDRIDPNTKGFFSIRNINQLIVGADGHSKSENGEDGASEDAEDLENLYTGPEDKNYDFKKYGLYIADLNGEHENSHGMNAYIAGSLEAAGRALFADADEFKYQGPKIQLGGMDAERDENGVISKAAENFLIEGEVGETTTTDDDGNEVTIPGGGTVKIIKDKIIVSDEDITESDWSGTNVLLMKDGDKNDEKGNEVEKPSYNEEPKFQVVADSNMAVNGILAAGQLDTQKIRTSSISVGSENIDDAVKWMDVDNDGIHIRNREGANVDEDNPTKIKSAKSQVEINRDAMIMRFDSEAKPLKNNSAFTEHASQVLMDEYGIEMRIRNTDESAEHKIGVATDSIRMEMEKDEMRIGGQKTVVSENNVTETSFGTSDDSIVEQYRVQYNKGGHVDMVGTTLQVTDKNAKPVFTIQGNDEKNINDKANDQSIKFEEGKRKNTAFKIAGHGNTVFTSDAVGTDDDNNATKFLAMGVDASDDDENMNNNQYNAAVNIVGNNTSAANSDQAQRVLYIDLDERHTKAFVGGKRTGSLAYKLQLSKGEIEKNTYMPEGSIYIRKGLIDIAPKSSDVSSNNQSTWTADEASGTVRASRFVANNVNEAGEQVKYKNPIDKIVYEKYNGSSQNPYDTYMVNPAYTSVMKDIKLTSRLGARLSDILPDFIVKAIYVSRNTYDEDGNNLKFDTWGSAAEDNFKSGRGWASPYLGRVVAPQCPPGYGRVITVVPQEFKMSYVGQLAATFDDGMFKQDIGSGFYVDDEWGARNPGVTGIKYLESGYLATTGTTLENRSSALQNIQASYEKLGLAPGLEGDAAINLVKSGFNVNSDLDEENEQKINDADNNILKVRGKTNKYPDNFKASQLGLQSVYVDLADKPLKVEGFENIGIYRDVANLSDDGNYQQDIDNTYVLSSGIKDGLPPMTFQQSTWLKATTQQLCDNKKEDNTCEGYMQGWAVLMGFIYPEEIYGNIAANLGNVGNIEAAKDEETYYWNVFPIKAGTLEAQITTYCYIDNKRGSRGTHLLGNDVTGWWSTDKTSDSYDYDVKSVSSNYKPEGEALEYRKSLNDPMLKYDEYW